MPADVEVSLPTGSALAPMIATREGLADTSVSVLPSNKRIAQQALLYFPAVFPGQDYVKMKFPGYLVAGELLTQLVLDGLKVYRAAGFNTGYKTLTIFGIRHSEYRAIADFTHGDQYLLDIHRVNVDSP